MKKMISEKTLRWCGLILLVLLTAVACTSTAELPEEVEVDVQELSAQAQSYIEMSEQVLAEQLDIDPETITLESITEPATEDGLFTIRLTVGEQIYELHGRDNEVLLVSDPLPPAPTDDSLGIDEAEEMSLYSSADLVFRLEDAGATVRLPTEPEPAADIFSVPGQYINVGNERIQVYVYDSPELAGIDAARVAAAGYTIEPGAEDGAAVAVDWDSTPHFYLYGNLIVLYVGEDPETLNLLESVMGPPLAG